MKIAVVGAGIIGSSIAYHLTQKGAKVEIIEASRPGAGTSTATFAYLNALRSAGHYADLRLRAIRYWHSLAERIGAERFIRQDGSIYYTDTEADARQLEHHIAISSAAGLLHEKWTAKRLVQELEPDLLFPDTEYPIVRLPQEGRLEPAPVIARLLGAAQEQGAALVLGEQVIGIESARGRPLITTSQRKIEADHIVVCAGQHTKGVLGAAGAGLPLEIQPGVIAVTRPIPVRLRHVVYAGKVHFQPDGGGRIVAGRTDYRKQFPAQDEAREAARTTAALVKPWVRGFSEDEVEAVRIGVRAIPGDGLPMVGPVPKMSNVTVAVMHSGISLGGLMGKMLASEIVNGIDEPDLAPYRPQRFINGVETRTDFAPWGPGDEIKAVV